MLDLRFEFVELNLRVKLLELLGRSHQLVVTALYLCSGQFTIASKVLWAKASINHVCNTLTTFSCGNLVLLTLEETVPVILLFYELC
jgi:hypothetical protein